jgi:hypothetical protein
MVPVFGASVTRCIRRRGATIRTMLATSTTGSRDRKSGGGEASTNQMTQMTPATTANAILQLVGVRSTRSASCRTHVRSQWTTSRQPCRDRHARAVDTEGPSDTELLAAGGWADVAGACVLAKSWDGDFCAALVNTHGGDETNPYSTIVECFDRDDTGRWRSLGHNGPVARRPGTWSGSFNGRWSYEFGWSEEDGSWWVIAVDES